MPRHPRMAPGGYLYHALNRGVTRLALFEKPGDDDAFESVLAEAPAEHPMRVLACCVLPTHWHFVLWPEREGALTAFLRWLTHTHAQRWHAHYDTSGTGHLSQGRFRASPIQADDHLDPVLRYVERNPLRAGLVARADTGRWSSLARRQCPAEALRPLVHPWPVPRPGDLTWHVQRPETEVERAAVRRCTARSQPFGSERWQRQTATRWGLWYTFRPRGRPRK